MTRVIRLLMLAFLVLLTGARAAQQVAAPRAGTLVEATVASSALKGNLLGDPSESGVAIYLPPSYRMSPEGRYPTLYLLHGYFTGVEVFVVLSGTPGF